MCGQKVPPNKKVLKVLPSCYQERRGDRNPDSGGLAIATGSRTTWSAAILEDFLLQFVV